MYIINDFYMHEKSMDVCVKVVKDYGNLFYEVEWWTLGTTGNPWRTPVENSIVYMHPDVWRNITQLMHSSRPWSEK
jgi:hypothetical protein